MVLGLNVSLLPIVLAFVMFLNLFSVWFTYLNLIVQHDVLVKFCNHNCDSKSTGSNLEACKLVIVSASIVCSIRETKYRFDFVCPSNHLFFG
jgi:hypothetical protein